ncbi:MAG: anti-anti-sigma factor [Zetaproteobacteria bacterium CG12_big_fil_rev_8_21_14_0_65_54_13]|nr:MAG: anti-anti-sigma factor [Zetaproteobacteria bacterium CG23_combo_of_CG06-09_8_20_14_all_54_7]PIW50031.1 MAG: anti-anti-sigma factor [Zetaproteobacteria bacterium CG12_big_fil_rev_8_21_14_0_65_54_13]PIX54656.1 MAG: anti-anti-sigma factor [Zetaproteobacteria bacterium CG_4_10_14_3_um_filter_54_28]PJA30750.1 MAG: anti-anti-sigma factor [Zetaproteobacteria bacterium CG_4_9_14_3_um_filter_54_145]
MDVKLTFEHENRDTQTALLRVHGDVTIHTSPRLREELKPLFSASIKEVRVVLNDVDFMDSSGIATLVEGLQWSRLTGGRFILSGLSENVRDVFELAKLDTVFDIEDSAA